MTEPIPITGETRIAKLEWRLGVVEGDLNELFKQHKDLQQGLEQIQKKIDHVQWLIIGGIVAIGANEVGLLTFLKSLVVG